MQLVAIAKRFFLTPPLPVKLVPAEAFFVLCVPCPTAVYAEQLDLAKLALEEAAPFPIDQLFWGFLGFDNDSQLLIYATTKERLRAMDCRVSADDIYSYPSFFAGIPKEPFEHKTVRAILWKKSLSFLSFEPGSRLPKVVRSVALDPELTDDFQQAAALFEAERLHFEKQGYTLEPRVIFTKKATALPNRAVKIDLQSIVEGHGKHLPSLEWDYSPRLLWADIREESFKIKEQKSRKLSQALGYAFWAAMALVGILVFGELLRFGCMGVLHFREGKIKDQAAAVDLVLENQRLIDHILGIYEKNLNPFAMLQTFSGFRPKGLYFTQFIAENAFRAEIKGVGASVDQVNDYAAALTESPLMEQVDLVDVQTRQGKVQFVLKAELKPTQTALLVFSEDSEKGLPVGESKESAGLGPSLEETGTSKPQEQILDNPKSDVIDDQPETVTIPLALPAQPGDDQPLLQPIPAL